MASNQLTKVKKKKTKPGFRAAYYLLCKWGAEETGKGVLVPVCKG